MNSVVTRQRLEAEISLLLFEAKEKYGTWERVASAIGVSTKSLHRYLRGKVLPSLEVYALLCASVGRRHLSEREEGGVFLFLYSKVMERHKCFLCVVFFYATIKQLAGKSV